MDGPIEEITDGTHAVDGVTMSTAVEAAPVDQRPAAIRRAKEYQREALADADTLTSNLGIISGGLMEITHELQESICSAMREETLTLERVQRLLPALAAHSRSAKLVTSFARLGLQTAAAREQLGTFPLDPRGKGQSEEMTN